MVATSFCCLLDAKLMWRSKLNLLTVLIGFPFKNKLTKFGTRDSYDKSTSCCTLCGSFGWKIPFLSQDDICIWTDRQGIYRSSNLPGQARKCLSWHWPKLLNPHLTDPWGGKRRQWESNQSQAVLESISLERLFRRAKNSVTFTNQ